MKPVIIHSDQGKIEASYVPANLLGPPGMCPVGVYETVLLEGSQPRDLNLHHARLSTALKVTGISEFDAPDLHVLSNLPGDKLFRMRMMVYENPQRLLDGGIAKYLVVIWEEPENLAREIRLGIVSQRRPAGDKSYNIKRLGLSDDLKNVERLKEAGFADGVFLNSNEEICETLYANLVVVDQKGSVLTPSLDAPCLPGITVAKVLDRAAELDVPVERRPIPVREMKSAREIWLCSSVQGVRWVSIVEGYFNADLLPPNDSLFSNFCEI